MVLRHITMELHDLDPLTLSVVVQMHLDDLRDLAENANRKGKGRDGEISDSVAAMESYRIELSSNAQLLSDRAMCQSMARAVALDADEIRALEAEEEQSTRDREFALRLSGRRGPRAATTPNLGDEMAGKMETLVINSQDDDIYSPGHVESSAWAASRRTKDLEENLSGKKSSACVACGDTHYSFNVVTCPGCHHEYCRVCLRSLFEASMTDESAQKPCSPSISSADTHQHCFPRSVAASRFPWIFVDLS
jgi:hypothetical protein